MKILLTNDDGIHAEGLLALYQYLRPYHQVTVIAPDRERSGVSHAISLDLPLRVQKIKVSGMMSVNGTPADCVKLGLVELLDHKPDIVISGINPGPNVGAYITYSGTVAGAREAVLCGVPAMAVSVQRDASGRSKYGSAVSFTEKLIHNRVAQGLPAGVFLNVNIPVTPIGVRVCHQGIVNLEESFEKRRDPRNLTYYWQGPYGQNFEEHDGGFIDGLCLEQNYITITPLKCDTTDYSFLEDLKKRLESIHAVVGS